VVSLIFSGTSLANTDTASFDLKIDFTGARLQGVTLGDDVSLDRLDNDEIKVGFDFSYPVNDQFFLFFGAELFDENETIKNANTRFSESGFELGNTGIGYTWGDEVEYQFEIGHIEYSDERQWWWDEYLDTLRLQFETEDLEWMLAAGRQQSRQRSSDEFIDPEEEGINRILANIHWNLPSNQRLSFYYLLHNDESASYALNESIDENRTDQSDADLGWFGVAYQGALEQNSIGNIDWRISYAQVSGDEIMFSFSNTTVTDIERFIIDASAYELMLEWKPEWGNETKFIISHAVGSGDSNPGDSRDKSFRQSGLQGNEYDYHYYGELYQPELSNIQIHSLGVNFEAVDDLDITLIMHNYRQDELDTEMREVAIDFDTNGLNRDLGNEIDLIATFAIADELEIKFISAVFEAGDAYSANSGKKSRYWSIELNYEF